MYERVQMLFLQMIPFLLAIVFHEYGHAIVARKHGDKTAEQMGRLTLNPIPHIDPIGTILFPAINILTGFNFLFGWAKPVPINFNALKPHRRGLFLTAIAGPFANVLLAQVMAIFLVLFGTYSSSEFYLYVPLTGMAMIGIQINFALCVFNLLPLPPLDGSKIVESMLSYNQVQKFEKLQSFSFFILLGLLWTGVLNFLAYPVIGLSNASIGLWRTVFGL